MSGAFRSKLARLRRDEPTREAPERDASSRPSDRTTLPAWLGKTLARRGASREESIARFSDAGAGWTRTEGDPLQLRALERDEGTVTFREVRIPRTPTRHGDWSLDEVTGVDPRTIARLAGDPTLAALDLEDAVFLDTETTGLSGGAGVYVYMVGLGWFDGAEYVSWQGFLRHPGEERALLAECAERIASRTALVSFFGKSFDRHRLEDKMRIVGVEAPFAGRPHLDLYHPFRRLTKGAFENGKLQTMERELLAFRRERDLPGSLAPAAWFDYLAGRPHLLEGVFQHNHEDVLSLVVLAAYLGRASAETRVCGESLAGPRARRALALAGVAESPEEALRWLETALERGLVGDARRTAIVRRAEILRKLRRVPQARLAYREALEECADDVAAVPLFVGASMLLEHLVKDEANALRMAQRAIALARSIGTSAAERERIAARVHRLAERVERTPERDLGSP